MFKNRLTCIKNQERKEKYQCKLKLKEIELHIVLKDKLKEENY